MHWLQLDTTPPVAIYRDPAARALTGLPLALPALVSLGTLRRALARPGEAESEIANMTARLDNANGQIAELFGADWPLGLGARVMSEAGEVWRGLVTAIDMGATVGLSIEAGGAQSLASRVRLRSTAAWGEYDAPEWLPWVYGRATLAPIQFSQDRRVWLVADHAIEAVESATRDDVATAAWAWRNATDSTGQAVALVELAEPLAEGERLAVTLRGKLHATRGTLLTRPDDVLADFLANLCGIDVAAADLDALRDVAVGVALGGVIADGTRSARAVVDDLMRATGAAWSDAMPGWAVAWPPVDDGAAVVADYDALTATDVSARSEVGAIVTVLRVLYDYDWAAGKHRRVLSIEAPEAIERYGRIEREIDVGWLHSRRHAETLARAWLSRWARPLVAVSWRAALNDDAVPGAWVTLDHTHSPLAGRHRLVQADRDMDRASMTLAIAAPVGAEPRLTAARLASKFDAYIQAGAAVVYQDGTATFTLQDDAGQPMAGATVTLDDGAARRLTDSAGRVQFSAARGAHVLLVQAAGYADLRIEVTL